MHANLTLAYSFGPHPLQPPSSLPMLTISDSTAVQKLRLNFWNPQIRKHVSIKDLGEIQSILGIEVIRDWQARTISLSHHCLYWWDCQSLWSIRSKGMFAHLSKWVLASLRLNAHQHQKRLPSCTPSHTRPAVGLLNHAAVMTRPDISKAVQTVAQFASNPGKHHWDAVICIICYLRTTCNLVLTLGRNLHLLNSLVTAMLTMPTLQIMVTPFQGTQWYW